MKPLYALFLPCLVAGAFACQTPKRWHLSAYDLSGKNIYTGYVITGDGPMHTTDGREISFLNATLVMREILEGEEVRPAEPKSSRPTGQRGR